MADLEDGLMRGVEVAQVATDRASPAALRGIDLAGQMCCALGAAVYADDHFEPGDTFAGRGKQRLAKPVGDWLSGGGQPVLLVAASHDDDLAMLPSGAAAVVLRTRADANEATLFAESGLADLLGDPNGAPIIPNGDYGVGTAAYAVLCALAGLVAKQRRAGTSDVVNVDAAGVLRWVNWKAAAAAEMGRDIHRRGDQAEWPVVPCADGHVALVYQERDWPNLMEMVSDPSLAQEKFNSFAGRAKHRSEYMDVLRGWAATRSKAEINQAFIEHDIPAAPVMTAEDLLDDALLRHRSAFVSHECSDGVRVRTPRLAHRIAASVVQRSASKPADGPLPLSGMRVLDLGIITAGAGVSALLADLGAEVLKVESHTYPDPFRRWAGEAVSPLFKCNNRNKYGVALDLKTPDGRARFLELVKTADVVVENFRRGVLERLGIGYDVLSAVNPSILLASISGQGLTGPGCGASSFGSTLEASSGFSANVTDETGLPYITGRNVNYPDQTVVLYAAAIIALALTQPNRGMHLDVSQRDVAVYLLGEHIESVSSGETAQAQDNGRCHRTADEQWLAVGASGVPSSIAYLKSWVAQRPAAEALAELAALGVGSARVLTGSEMYAADRNAAQSVFARSPDGALVKGTPFQFAETPMSIRLDSPAVGEHTERFCS